MWGAAAALAAQAQGCPGICLSLFLCWFFLQGRWACWHGGSDSRLIVATGQTRRWPRVPFTTLCLSKSQASPGSREEQIDYPSRWEVRQITCGLGLVCKNLQFARPTARALGWHPTIPTVHRPCLPCGRSHRAGRCPMRVAGSPLCAILTSFCKEVVPQGMEAGERHQQFQEDTLVAKAQGELVRAPSDVK